MSEFITITSSRFNQATWEENSRYRRERQIDGCIYGSPSPLSSKIVANSLVFIIEMNNTLNKIEGIGLVYNKIQYDKYYMVYETGNYNRYIYKSNYRLDRSELQKCNPDLVKALDKCLFKGKTHLKRGSGITIVPEKLLTSDTCKHLYIRDTLSTIFKEHFKPTEN
uniref:Uncharacterized protein n=1 Tax=viral metagenome TaxID=1070528 RepID=A0A6C0B0F0_9ZZZZ